MPAAGTGDALAAAVSAVWPRCASAEATVTGDGALCSALGPTPRRAVAASGTALGEVASPLVCADCAMAYTGGSRADWAGVARATRGIRSCVTALQRASCEPRAWPGTGLGSTGTTTPAYHSQSAHTCVPQAPYVACNLAAASHAAARQPTLTWCKNDACATGATRHEAPYRKRPRVYDGIQHQMALRVWTLARHTPRAQQTQFGARRGQSACRARLYFTT